MKVICDREKLWSAYSIAASVAPSRSPKPILQNVKFEANDDSAIVMATDLELGVRIEVAGVKTEAAGSVVLPIDRFGPILRESSDATLKLETDGQNIVVRGERSEFRLPAENPMEFPNVGQFEVNEYLEAPARLLRELIRRTAFATDNESSRYALGGVLLELEGDQLTAVGTDGRRLAVMVGSVKLHGDYRGADTMTIVPTRSMQFLDKTLSDSDAEVRINARANDVLIQSGRSTIYSRLVEGRFPKWRDVIPRRDDSQRIDLVAGPLLSAVRQAQIVTSEESKGVDFSFGEGKLILSGRAAEKGQSRVELPIAYDGPPVVIALDPKFVADFLRVLDPDKALVFDVKDSESAAICSTDDGYTYVIMPLSREK